MTFGNKLSALRKENNYTQEQLAELLGVSRQSISKWESDTAYPETEKLIRISTLFDCSLDYLLRDVPRTPAAPQSCELQPTVQPEPQVRVILPPVYGALYGYERKSSQTFRGVPLYHINIGPGRVAHGIIAIGLIARGVVSLGLISMGILSLGVVSLGLVAIGTLAAGLLSLGPSLSAFSHSAPSPSAYLLPALQHTGISPLPVTMPRHELRSAKPKPTANSIVISANPSVKTRLTYSNSY